MIKDQGHRQTVSAREDKECLFLAKFADYLSPEVLVVIVNDDGLLTGVSTDSNEDDSLFVAYIPFSMIKSLPDCSRADCCTIFYSKFEELDPLGPGVDLLSYKGESGTPQKVTFKFNVIKRPICLQMAWDEVNILKNLPPHLNTEPFDCVILEDVESQMIGFTTKYIPGGILANSTNLKVPFRFEWL